MNASASSRRSKEDKVTVKLNHQIKRYVTAKSFPDCDTYDSISVENVIRLSQQFKVSGKEVELAALKANIVPERYVRNMESYTIEDQAVLLKSKGTVSRNKLMVVDLQDNILDVLQLE